jgi:hypothetical protein
VTWAASGGQVGEKDICKSFGGAAVSGGADVIIPTLAGIAVVRSS